MKEGSELGEMRKKRLKVGNGRTSPPCLELVIESIAGSESRSGKIYAVRILFCKQT